MVLAFPSDGTGIDNNIDKRFGRSAFFVSYDTESKDLSFVNNEQNYQAVQGAGIQSATHVVNMKADVCICSHCGPKAFKVFDAAGIKVITGAEGKIRDVIRKFENGELSYASSADVEGHWV